MIDIKDRKFGLKHIVGFNLITVVAAIILTATIVTASFTVYNLYLDALPHTATYTMETDGSGNYRAIKYNGQALWDSTNASYVFNSARDALAATGGEIFFPAGTYTFPQPLTVTGKSGISITGEGYSTEIRCSAADYIIKVRNAGRVKISDLALVLWYGANLGGLEVYNTFSSDFNNINILGINSTDARIGVLIDKDDTDPSFEAAYWNMFSNFIIRTFGTEVKITGGANAQNFIQSEFLGFTDGINIDDGDAIVISQSYFESFSGVGILINDNWARTLGNRFETATVDAIGINVTSNSTNSHLVGDIFYIPNGIRIVDDGSDTILDEVGYKNSGTATNSTATTFVFNHGLVNTATGVWASFNTTAITGWTWTATSTQITITVTGTLPEAITTYWNAIYKP